MIEAPTYDCVLEAISHIKSIGFHPDMVIMHPKDAKPIMHRGKTKRMISRMWKQSIRYNTKHWYCASVKHAI